MVVIPDLASHRSAAPGTGSEFRMDLHLAIAVAGIVPSGWQVLSPHYLRDRGHPRRRVHSTTPWWTPKDAPERHCAGPPLGRRTALMRTRQAWPRSASSARVGQRASSSADHIARLSASSCRMLATIASAEERRLPDAVCAVDKALETCGIGYPPVFDVNAEGAGAGRRRGTRRAKV